MDPRKSMKSWMFYKCGREITVGDRVRATTGGWYGVIDLDEKENLVVKSRVSQFRVAGREHKLQYVGR